MVCALIIVLGEPDYVREELVSQYIKPVLDELKIQPVTIDAIKEDPLFSDDKLVLFESPSWKDAVSIINTISWRLLLVLSHHQPGKLHIEGADSSKGSVFEIKTSTAFKRVTKDMIKDILIEYCHIL